jgi:hypothetical protein
MSPGVQKLVKVGLIILLCIIFADSLFRDTSEAVAPSSSVLSGKDFISYYFGANIVRSGKVKELYNLNVQRNYRNVAIGINSSYVLPFRGLPILTYVYMPFSVLDPATAFSLFLVCSIFLLVLSVYLLATSTGVNSVLILVLCFINTPFIFAIYQGQPSIIFLLCLVASYYLVKKEKFLIGGLVLSFLFMKIQYLPLALIFTLLVNNKKYLWGFITGTIVIFVVNILMYGISLPIDYTRFLASTETPAYGSAVSSALYGLFGLLNVPNTVHSTPWLLLLNAFLFIALIIRILVRRTKIQSTLEDKISFSIGSGLFLGIHIIHHDLVPYIIPLVFSFMYAKKGLGTYFQFGVSLLIYLLIGYLGVVNLKLNIIAILLTGFAVYYYGKRVGVFKRYI